MPQTSIWPITVVGALFLLLAAPGYTAPKSVSPEEASRWLRWVIPLPRQVKLERKVTVSAAGVSLVVPAPGEVEQTAAEELKALFQEKCEVSLPVAQRSADGKFKLILGVATDGKLAGHAVPGLDTIRQCLHPEQAYVIAPMGDSILLLAALDSRGAYYAAKTLQQLLEPTFQGKGATATVDVPLCEIADWPELAERGLWGGSADKDVRWLADRKMNLVETHSSLTIDAAGHGVGKPKVELIDEGRRHALKVVPIITHLDQLGRTGLFKRFPETKGLGEHARRRVGAGFIQAACFAQPKTQEILADWFSSLASYPGVTDINVWLSEHHVRCTCPECQASGQYALEARGAVNAWKRAVKKTPHVKLRILLTQGSYSSNDKVLAEVPPEVGVTYYDGGRTYNSNQEPMIYPLLEQYAAQGRWLGCYPQLTASWRIVCPWSGPQFIKYRMTEFADKKLQCLCGYATPSNRFYEFNVTAAAEWSWNPQGRSEREFALAWATRERLSDPEKAADWAVTLGPVGWDVYGAGVPYPWFFGRVPALLKQRKLPQLGEGCFKYFPNNERFAQNLAACREALRLATEVNDPRLIEETKTIEGFVKMLQAIHAMGDALGDKQELTDAEKAPIIAAMTALDQAANQTSAGLQAWGLAAAPEFKDGWPSRFTDTVSVVEQTAADVGVYLAKFGIEDPGAPYRQVKLGVWRTEDFAEGPEVHKKWEVTKFLHGPGRYQVHFIYKTGWYGLGIHRVTLMSAPPDQPDQLTEIARDEHEGTAAYRNVANFYEFDIEKLVPNLRYFVVADIRGCPKESPPDKQGCGGELRFRKLRPE